MGAAGVRRATRCLHRSVAPPVRHGNVLRLNGLAQIKNDGKKRACHYMTTRSTQWWRTLPIGIG